MDAACVKQTLVKQIQKLSEHPELYCRSPGRNFTRRRKTSFCTLISFILNMRGGPLTSEVKELRKDKNHYRYVPSTMKFDYLPLLTGTYGTKPVFYNIRYRIVRVRITKELAETLITNLTADLYPPEKLKELYAMRWGIETSFRSLKYTVGMLHFNSKKAE